MRHRTKFPALVAAICCVTGLALASDAPANSTQITRGDAQAVFEAGETGALGMLRGGNQSGSPAQWPEVAINFLNPNQRFCASYWHTIMLALFEGSFGGETRQQLFDWLKQDSVAFVLDGTPVSIGTTAIKRVVNSEQLADVEVLYGRNYGTLVPPNTLSVGVHKMDITIQFVGSSPLFVEEIFIIDGPGTGACL
jgi:hypothetical protein